MRVLFMNSIKAHLWRGGEKWMLEVASGLAARRHSVYLAVRPGSVIADRAAERSIEVFPIHFGPDIDPVNATRLRRFIKRNQIQLICTNFDKELRLAAFAGLFGPRPLIVARKGLPFVFDKWYYRFTYRRWVDHIVSPSESIARKLRGLPWLDGVGITVVPNGVPLSTAQGTRSGRSLRTEYGIAPGVPLVGFVGDLCPQKGLDTLLRAFQAVKDKCHLLVIGDGGERARLEQLAGRLSLGGRVTFAGHRNDAVALYDQFDVFVCPSRFEGMPNVVLEAMGAGRPVVASAVDGVLEIIKNDRVGMLVPPDEEKALAAALSELVGDKEHRDGMGRAAREWVLENFPLEKTVTGVEDLFQRLISGGNSPDAN
jgi:glycosyltransferase involved in cell wall biosynthesis